MFLQAIFLGKTLRSTCFFRLSFWVKLCPQLSQTHTFCLICLFPVCSLIWYFNPCLLLNPLPQASHLKALTCLWIVILWLVSAPLLLKFKSQFWQFKVTVPP